MASVIVPAYNEENVISRCLDSLLQQPGVDQIIVAANGCVDGTVDLVSKNYPQVLCLDIARPSKVNAINEAEKHVTHWPVVYIDADLILSENAIVNLTTAMVERGLLLASPTPIIDWQSSNWFVRQYYTVHRRLKYVKEGVIGTGTYVVDKEGRKRFGPFPEVINDDGFIRAQFHAHEMANIENSFVTVKAPRDAWSLIKIITRSRLGNIEIARKKLAIDKPKHKHGSAILPLLFSRYAISAVVYVALVSFAKLRARKQLSNLDTYEWEVDHSSRAQP